MELFRPDTVLSVLLLIALLCTQVWLLRVKRFRAGVAICGAILLLGTRVPELVYPGSFTASGLAPWLDVSGTFLAVCSVFLPSGSSRRAGFLITSVLPAAVFFLLYLIPFSVFRFFLPENLLSEVWTEAFFLIFVSIAELITASRQMTILRRNNREMIREMGESEKRFRLLFEESPEAIFWLDPGSGSILNCNPGAERFVGRKRSDLIGFPLSVIREAAADERLTELLTCLSSGTEREMIVLQADGRQVPVVVTPTVITVGSQKIIQGVFRDIRALKEVEKARQNNENNFRAILDATTESALLMDRDGNVLASNRAFAARLRKDMTEIGTATIYEGLSQEAAENRRLWVEEVVRTGRRVHFSDERDGRALDISFVPIFNADGNVERIAVFGHDVTDERRSEMRIRQFMKELERSNYDLERFAYIASHDLQEPLRSIRMFIERIDTRYSHLLDDKGKDYIRRVVQGAVRMDQLIMGLLQYSRVSSRGGDFIECDLNGVLRDTLDSLQVTIMKSGALVRPGPLPRLRADPVQIGQVFQNLIVNAIKYAKDDVKPEISIFAEKTDISWQIIVQDNGIGIAPEHYSRIFDIFQRLHDQSKYPGMGIGLAVCRRILERHGGNIRVSSAPGEGSRFVFSLPAVHGTDVPEFPKDTITQETRAEVELR